MKIILIPVYLARAVWFATRQASRLQFISWRLKLTREERLAFRMWATANAPLLEGINTPTRRETGELSLLLRCWLHPADFHEADNDREGVKLKLQDLHDQDATTRRKAIASDTRLDAQKLLAIVNSSTSAGILQYLASSPGP